MDLSEEQIEELKNKHEAIRTVLMDNDCKEYGDIRYEEWLLFMCMIMSVCCSAGSLRSPQAHGV